MSNTLQSLKPSHRVDDGRTGRPTPRTRRQNTRQAVVSAAVRSTR